MIDFLEWENLYKKAINNNLTNVCIFAENKLNKPIVTLSDTREYNKEYCEENNISVVYCSYAGGTLVFSPNDIALCWISNKDILYSISGEIVKYLKKYINELYSSGNDVMIGNKKLFGTTSKQLNDELFYQGFFVSFNPDVDLIKKICTKPMEKEPSGLSKWNIDRQEIIYIIEKALKDNGIEILS